MLRRIVVAAVFCAAAFPFSSPAATPSGGAKASAPAPALEQTTEPASTSYLGGTVGYLFQDEKLLTAHTRKSASMTGDSGTGFQFFYGQHSGSGFGWELMLFQDVIDTGKFQGTDYYRSGGGLDLVYSFGDREDFTPFILLGGGGAYDDQYPDNFDKWAGYGDAAIGFVSGDLGKGVHLRGEGRYVYDDAQQVNGQRGIEDVRVSLGLEIALWDRPKPLPAPKPQVVEKVVEVVKEVKTGLEDSDSDGIVDSKDKCPGTPAGTRVDGDGCPLPQVIQLRGVTFEFNKTRLRPDSKSVLDTVVEILKRYPGIQVEVAGHTDNIGSDAYNQKLSEGRAQAVRDYLVAAGVPAEALTAVGYGKTQPIASNDTDDGRELNRRVELRIKN